LAEGCAFLVFATTQMGYADARKNRCTPVGGSKAVISSNVKGGAAGASLDVPLGHTDDSWSFQHFDTARCRWQTHPAQTKSW
jgi:hypothetical protein